MGLGDKVKVIKINDSQAKIIFGDYIGRTGIIIDFDFYERPNILVDFDNCDYNIPSMDRDIVFFEQDELELVSEESDE